MRRQRGGARKKPRDHGRVGLSIALGVLAVLLLLGAAALVGPNLVHSRADSGTAVPSHESSTAGRADDGTHDQQRDRGQNLRPVRLDIPTIDVGTVLMSLGLQGNGEIEVPPLTRAGTAGWYRHSPAPGETGPAVIVGHVDSDTGPAVFYRLRSLRIGDAIHVRRTDGKVAEFRVTLVRTYPKTRFPTKRVYGSIRHAGLRLITCSGTYVAGKGGYQSNTVVYATLHRLAPADQQSPPTRPSTA